MNNVDYLRDYTPTLNPYVIGAFEVWRGLARILRRALWDLRPLSWQARRQMATYRERHAGQKCVILCNGPSLANVDFSALTGVTCFGLNKINLLFDKTEFRPTYLVCTNPLVAEQNQTFFNETEIPLFIGTRCLRSVRARPGVVFFDYTHTDYKMARDCSISIAEGCTVTYVAMQLAFHMGFSDVALVGCDHYFKAEGRPHVAVASGEKDEDHFDPNYFSGGQLWQLPDIEGSEKAYRLAGKTFAAFGRRIVNCTDGGALEIFPRMPLAEFLASSDAP